MKTDSVYLEQIVESTRSAVIMQLALIGELAKKVDAETRLKINVPWNEIAGFRDRAIHGYYQIDLGIAWDTITLDLEPLEKAIMEYL